MLIVIGSARALPGRRDDLVARAREVVTETRADDGCHSYGFYADLADEDTIISLEIWRDQGSLDEHMTHSHTREFLTHVSELIDGTPTSAIHDVPATE